MTGSPLDLDRRRSLGDLLNTAWTLYRHHFLLFATIAFGVVAPVELVVAGIGLGQLTGPYDPDPPLAGVALQGAVETFVITPLVTAMHVHAVLALSQRQRASIAETVRLGVAYFAAVVLVVLAYPASCCSDSSRWSFRGSTCRCGVTSLLRRWWLTTSVSPIPSGGRGS